jgi:hypothetical protein
LAIGDEFCEGTVFCGKCCDARYPSAVAPYIGGAEALRDTNRLLQCRGQQGVLRAPAKHSAEEYVRYEDGEAIHTNSAEGYFSIFKRGLRGIYQHCAEKHLHRYLAEFDFRYNHRVRLGFNDGERAAIAIKGAEGKRLTYRGPH